MTDQSPGTLLDSRPVATAISGAQAWRITYVSREVCDVAHEVTGLVMAPTRARCRPPCPQLVSRHGRTR